MTKTEILQSLLEAFNGDGLAAIEAVRNYRNTNHSKTAPAVDVGDIAISLHSVSKTYKLKRREIQVLKDVSLNIHKGEFVAITGPSGSGKSTLLQLIGGLDKATTGSIEIDKQDISKLSDGELSQMRNSTIGFIFQLFYLQPFLTLGKNIEIPGMFGRREQKERLSHSKELLDIVGIDELQEYYPKQLSGGQLQRAAISRALLNRPKIILADEPTGNLDTRNSAAIIEVFEDMRKLYNVTIVLVTHDNVIANRADRILSMKDGRII